MNFKSVGLITDIILRKEEMVFEYLDLLEDYSSKYILFHFSPWRLAVNVSICSALYAEQKL